MVCPFATAPSLIHSMPCSEFNYEMNAAGNCVLQPGLKPLPSDDAECWEGSDYWYDRTAYRKIPYSTCEGGETLHHGDRHVCPGFKAHGAAFWWTIFLLPFAVTALVAYWFYRRSGMARGYVITLVPSSYLSGIDTTSLMLRTIRLPGDAGGRYRSDSSLLDTVASVPWFLVGLAGITWEYIASSVGSLASQFQTRRGYRNVPVDEDAQILRFEDEE